MAGTRFSCSGHHGVWRTRDAFGHEVCLSQTSWTDAPHCLHLSALAMSFSFPNTGAANHTAPGSTAPAGASTFNGTPNLFGGGQNTAGTTGTSSATGTTSLFGGNAFGGAYRIGSLQCSYIFTHLSVFKPNLLVPVPLVRLAAHRPRQTQLVVFSVAEILQILHQHQLVHPYLEAAPRQARPLL
jgi:hypothetical protein